jgi:hypothetical protein
LRAAELLPLLGPLAPTLDFVSSQGLGLVDVSVRKILVACPPEIAPEKFSEFARGDAREWSRCRLVLNPLSLAPLLFRSRNGWDRQTIVPASRVLSMTQAQAGIRGSKAVRLYGRLVYELLSGHAPIRDADPQKYTPLSELDQAGNEILRRACMATDLTYPNCETFWNALKENLTGKERAFTPASLPSPPSISAAAPSAPPARLPKRRLVVGAILAGGLIIGLVLFAAIRFGGPGPGPGPPTPSVAAATPTPIPFAMATPTPSMSATPSQKEVTSMDVAQMYNLGVIYDKGQGVAQDYGKAREWYQKAADAGNTNAMVNLGWLYENGKGGAQDYGKALEWYQKAAVAGDANAMKNLGVLYYNRRGVTRITAKPGGGTKRPPMLATRMP